MSSQDFIELMKLIYFEKYEVKNFHFSYIQGTGSRVEVVLKKDNDEITLNSSQDDFVKWVVSLQNVSKFDGIPELFPVKDGSLYYEDVQHLTDDGNKISEAWKKFTDNKFRIDFDDNHYLHRLLHGDYDKHDDNFLKLKKQYWEILAFNLYNAKGILDTKTQFKDPYFIKYYDLIESCIRKALPFSDNLIIKYRQFCQLIMFDVHKSMKQLMLQYDIIEDFKDRITKEDGLEGNKAVLYVTDHYRRLCELCYNHLHSLYNMIVFSETGSIPLKKISYIDLVEYFKKDKTLSELVEFLDPNIRHSESHLGTTYEYDEKGVIESILYHDTRKKKHVLVAKYDFRKLVFMMNRMKNALVIALFYTFVVYLIALELLILKSKEYKFLLLRIGQE